jgi:aryl-alcohol dehydrogenase-like predicted oxidoreductase
MSISALGHLPVHRIGFGAMQLAGPGVFGPPADPAAARAVLRRAIELGVDHIDTAQFYGPDVVNDLIREALHPYPEHLRLVTKVGARRDDRGGWVRAGEPAQLKEQVEDNLRSLDVERIDLVNLRRFERDADIVEPALADQLGALAELREQGKIDMIGVSNVCVDTVRTAIETVGIGEVQNPFSILDRSDADVLELCRAHQVSYVPFFPLGSAFGGGGPNHLAADEYVRAVATKHGVTPSQVALAWLLAQYDRLLLIPGTSSVAHLEENLAVEDIVLDADDLALLAKVEPVAVGH